MPLVEAETEVENVAMPLSDANAGDNDNCGDAVAQPLPEPKLGEAAADGETLPLVDELGIA